VDDEIKQTKKCICCNDISHWKIMHNI